MIPETSVDLELEPVTSPAENRITGPASGSIRYVCMPGCPFTGSTLLGTLLNDLPDCASIGAAVGLIARADLSTYRCSCGRLFRECEFWHSVATRTRELGHPVNVFSTNHWNTHLRLSSNRLMNAALVRSLGWDGLTRLRDAVVLKAPPVRAAITQMGWNTWSLATAVLEKTGKSVFVDTSRDHQRPKYLAMHPRLVLKVIHLVRDPRGNSASIMKHTGKDAATAARQWTHCNVEAARVRQYLPAESWMSLRYEELCANPAGTLNRIADFLGVDRARPDQAAPSAEAHIIGNKGRLRGRTEVREDRSWEEVLSRADLAHIGRIAGAASHSFGFNWP